MLQILEPGGLENLQVVLKVQIVHKNAITSAVTQANVCFPVEEPEIRKRYNTAKGSDYTQKISAPLWRNRKYKKGILKKL